MGEPFTTGDPWIDCYLIYRQAWVEGATEVELADLAAECRAGLPSPMPPIPAALFIHRDILITSQQNALPPQLVTALWVPDSMCTARGTDGRDRPATRCVTRMDFLNAETSRATGH